MKSHLIPEPQPIDLCQEPSDPETNPPQPLKEPAQSSGMTRAAEQAEGRDDYHRVPDMSMRNFLRVVFAC